MGTRILWVAALAMCASAAHSATLSDKLRAHVGEPAKIANGKSALDAKLTSVEIDHFCVEVRPPGFTHERCYANAAISYISKPVGDRPLWIAVSEP